jgi:predicted metal-dependent phosphotriesterase family hydrolase
MHTNARNQNGRKALEILLSEGVEAKAVTVSHLSDTEELEYVKEIAGFGCFIGLDRLHGNVSVSYISQKLQSVRELWKAGYGDQILLSHDSLFFSGFDREPKINGEPRLAYCFDHILPEVTREMAEKIMVQNPARMLTCGEF